MRWARYLGFIAPSPRANGGYIPDPTQAVRDTLPALGRQVRKPIPITYFVSALSEALPVLDGGAYRTAVEKAMAAPPQSVGEEGEYSHSLSYALRRLAESGTLELLYEADAPGTRSLPHIDRPLSNRAGARPRGGRVSFERFVCWDRSELGLIETDAVDMPKAMFLATHQPMPVWGEEYGREGTRQLVDEKAVLEAFEQERTAPLIMPIIGSSGSGKSHLVRWLRYSLPERDDRLVIWVRRDRTSLADVVADLLDAIPATDESLTAAVGELREQLGQAAAVEMSDDELRRRLVQGLAHRIRRLKPADAPYEDAQGQDPLDLPNQGGPRPSGHVG